MLMKAINLAKNSAFGLMSKTSGIYASNTVLGQYNGSNDLREAAKTYLIAKESVRDAENQRALWISKGKDKYERELRRYYAEEADTWVTADIEKILKRDKLLMQSELKQLEQNKETTHPDFYEARVKILKHNLDNFDREADLIREKAREAQSKSRKLI